jgi:hypothetical protein
MYERFTPYPLIQQYLLHENLQYTKLNVFYIWKLAIIKIQVCNYIGCFIFIILERKVLPFYKHDCELHMERT